MIFNSKIYEEDFQLQVSRGLIPGIGYVNKFGRSTNVDSGVDTDIWDRANATDDQDIWVAPTAARIHTIQSSDATDTTGDVGANSVKVYYLPDWNTAEANETVTGDLGTGIAMSNAAVIIHRMKVIPQASSTSANVGTITATAATDATVTAQINPGQGQTQMAIYGIPSTHTLYMRDFYLYLLKKSAVATPQQTDFSLLFNPDPTTQLLSFLTKFTGGARTDGSSHVSEVFRPPEAFPGPGILKMQATGGAADLDVSAGFNALLIAN